MQLTFDRTPLEEGWIDASYGEPLVIAQSLKEVLSANNFKLNSDNLLFGEYASPIGNKALIKLLESRYNGGKIIITAGGKHGLNAVMYALKKLYIDKIMIHSPYWSSTPEIIKRSGLDLEILSDSQPMSSSAFLVTSPNNPNGFELSQDKLDHMFTLAKEDGIKLIHDAAYNTPIYTSNSDYVRNISHCQIYTYSKMYGLSGLRVGYVVTYDDDLYRYISEYVDNVSTCVSTAAQDIALQIEQFFASNPQALLDFEQLSRQAIIESRQELASIRSDVLEISGVNSNSMFALCKVMPHFNADKAKVKFADGATFGIPGYIRVNLAIGRNYIEEIVKRLNNG